MQKFNYHSHTYRCGHADFDMKDEDYIKEYIKMGFEKIAFTDHCPEKLEIDSRPNIRMRFEEKEEYINSIKILKEKYKDKIKIETGYEIEYLPKDEDNLMELKNECDKMILGQHFIYDNNKLLIFGRDNYNDDELIRYAEYIEKSIQLELPDIIAHPDMYMLNRKKFGEIESKVANIICKAVQKYNIPLEINLSNIYKNTYFKYEKINSDILLNQKRDLLNVSYPCREFWKIASKYDIKVLYGIDTHYKGKILLFNKLIELANDIIGNETIEKLNFIIDTN